MDARISPSSTRHILARLLAVIALLIPLTLFQSVGVNAATIRVPLDQPTIQAGINAAANGDTVLVAPGTYVQTINFIGKAITVQSEAGPASTIIDGNRAGTVVTFGSGEGRSSVLQGFTVRNGSATFGAGMTMGAASPTIVGNIFSNNLQSAGGYGAAIGGNVSSPLIAGNSFVLNSCDDQFLSGVISFINGSSPVIVNNIIVNNPCRGINMTLPEGNTPVVINNTIVGNRVGVRVDARVPTGLQTYENNILVNNNTGLQVDFGAAGRYPTWKYNLVFANGTDYSGIPNQTGITGNISADPQFVDPSHNDYHLQTTSPSIDAGTNGITVLPSTDFDGHPRIVDGNSDGVPVIDQGAYELAPSQGCATVPAAASGGVSFGNVVAGQTYSYQASGEAHFNFGVCEADPDGNLTINGQATNTCLAIQGDSTFTCPGLQGFSLVGKVNGACIQLGSGGTFVAPSSGALTLYFNDDNYSDNSGSWSVCITPVQQVCVTVPAAASGGVSVGNIVAGQTYAYQASGCITYQVDNGSGPQSVHSADPDGNSYTNSCTAFTSGPQVAGSGFSCPGLISVSLVGRIGGSSCIQLGQSGTFVAPSSGQLVLYFNDVIFGDNSGSWSVCITPLQPPPPCLVSCPTNQTVFTGPGATNCGAVFSYPAPTTSGSCGPVNCSPPSGSFFPVGTTPVSCSVTNGPSCSFNVTVVDRTPPSISCPANITTTAPTGTTSVVVGYPAPSVGDNCGTVSVACAPPSGSLFSLGTNSVTCTATDAAGNINNCGFSVLVLPPLQQVCASVPAAASGGVPFGNVVAGQTYSYQASGVAHFNFGVCEADPDGNLTINGQATNTCLAIQGDSTFTCPGLQGFSLVGKVNGACIQLGSGGTFVAPSSGALTLYFNDDNYSDNSGSWSVCITPVQPPSQQVCVTVPAAASGGVSFGNVVVGQTYAYTASGCARRSLEPNFADPDGSQYTNGCSAFWKTDVAEASKVCPGLINFSLVGKINDTCIQLGKNGTFVAPASGPLVLYFNDDNFSDNSGSWNVCITPEQPPCIVTCPTNLVAYAGATNCGAVVNYPAPTTNSPSGPVVIYSNDFEGTVGPEWSNISTDVTPIGARHFLGQFGSVSVDQAVTLTLSNIPPHTGITVSFDLFIIASWDGHGIDVGPDIWDLTAVGVTNLLHTTFSNVQDCFPGDRHQDYPGTYPGSDFPERTGASETNSLGYHFAYGSPCTTTAMDAGDTVYHLTFSFPHTDSALALKFSDSLTGLVLAPDESWGLDNVVVSYAAPATNGPCGPVSCSPPSGSFFPVGTTPVSCSVTNGPSCSFNVTVVDRTPPSISCPANITTTAPTGTTSVVVIYPAPSVGDNCGTVTAVCAPPSGSLFPIGTNSVTCAATDAAGNTNNCGFGIIVLLPPPPCLVSCPTNMTVFTVPGATNCGAVVNYPAPSTSGPCGLVTCSPPSGSFFPVGTTPVSCSVSNSPSCSFNVTVVDRTPPSISCPANITTTAPTGSTSVVVSYPAPSVGDNCGTVTVACIPPSGSLFSLGTNSVTCTATDGSGNTNNCGFSVLVESPPCPSCDSGTVTVDQSVTVDFNTDPPTYSGDPDLLPFASYDKTGPTPDTWKAIFDVGGKALLITSNATITTTPVPASSKNRRAPGIEIDSTCTLTVDEGSKILVQSENRDAGDILIQVDGDVTINGTVSNAVNGTRGRPGGITIGTSCGNIVTGPGSRIITYGQDYGGSDINLATCESGDITINGLVDASYKALSASTINIASFGGDVTIIGTNRFGTEVVAGTLRTVTSGVSVRSRRDPLPGTIKIQAQNNLIVIGSTLLSKKYPNYGAVAIKTASNSSNGGLIDARGGLRIFASDRAFDDANRFNAAAQISLQAGDNISLIVTPSIDDGASNNSKPVVSTQGGDTGKGGTNILRSFNGLILIGNAQVLADFSGRPGAGGANLLTACLGVNNSGTVAPADLVPGDDSGVCGGTPDPLFLDCSDLGF
jgi:hypothetical protein